MSEMDGDAILAAIGAQLAAMQVIGEYIAECGAQHPDEMAQAIIARLARHDPPILLAFPHELRDD